MTGDSLFDQSLAVWRELVYYRRTRNYVPTQSRSCGKQKMATPRMGVLRRLAAVVLPRCGSPETAARQACGRPACARRAPGWARGPTADSPAQRERCAVGGAPDHGLVHAAAGYCVPRSNTPGALAYRSAPLTAGSRDVARKCFSSLSFQASGMRCSAPLTRDGTRPAACA